MFVDSGSRRNFLLLLFIVVVVDVVVCFCFCFTPSGRTRSKLLATFMEGDDSVRQAVAILLQCTEVVYHHRCVVRQDSYRDGPSSLLQIWAIVIATNMVHHYSYR